MGFMRFIYPAFPFRPTNGLRQANPLTDLLEQETGCLVTLLFVIQRDAIITPMLDAHPVHIEPPALGVILIHLRTAHFNLQTWGQDSLHSLLHRVFTPVSAAQCIDLISSLILHVEHLPCLKFYSLLVRFSL